MNENKKESIKNNSSNDISFMNATNIISKNINISNNKENKIKKPFKKIKTAYKKDAGTGDFKINEKLLGKARTDLKFKRVWSTQNIFLYNMCKTSKYGKHLFNKNINFYSGAAIYSAPSVKENRIEINKLLKSGKNKRINYLNNIHNNMMIKSSKKYRKKINFFSKDNSFDNKTKLELKRKYNMNDMNEIDKIKKKLYPINRGYFITSKNRRNFSGIDLSLKRYQYLKQDMNNNLFLNNNENKNNYKNENTLSTKYLSKKPGYEITNKTNEMNYITNYSKIMSAGTINLIKNNKKPEYVKKKPLLKNYLSAHLLEKNGDEIKNNDLLRLYKDIEISNMSLDLNNIIFNNTKKVLKLDELEKKLMKYQTLKEFQEVRLKIMSKQDINGLQNRIILLQDNIKKYNKISYEYFLRINNYLHYLKEVKYTLSNFFEEENNKRFNLYFDIEKLVTENILKQKELEHLIEIKLFLIQVKNTLIKQPNYFSNILKENSRKYELGKLIISLKVVPQNQNVTKFLESIPDIKEAGDISSSTISQNTSRNNIISKTSLKKKSKKYSQVTNLRSKLTETNITKYLNFPEKQIFESPDEFIIIFDNIESKNLRLMKENDYIKKNRDHFKKELDEMLESNTIIEKYNDINQKEERIKKLMKENLLLKEKYDSLRNNKNEDEENNFEKKNKKSIRTFIMDINVFQKITYYKMLQNYKYKGLLLLDRLLEIVSNVFSSNYSGYGIEKAYNLVGKNNLNKIISINKKNINSLDRLTINNYLLCLLKIYENVCQFVKFKDIEYNSIEANKVIIHKKKEEIQLQRKIKNTRTIRQLSEEKRINGMEKIIKRNNRQILIFKGNADDNIVLKNKIKKMKKLEEMGKYKQNFLEREFKFYVNYNDD